MVIAGNEKAISAIAGNVEVASRISFMTHDFLTPQPVLDADVFIFRFVIHDWSDHFVIKVLHNLLPAMKKIHELLS